MAWPTGYTLNDRLVLQGTTLGSFVVYVKGSDLSPQFWANVRTDGGDIRASLDDETTELPIQVAYFDYATETARIFVGPVSKVNGTAIRLWVNGTDTAVSVSATYGRNAVWANFRAVLHLQEAVNNTSDGYVDSTGNGYDGTGTSMSITAPTGKLEGKCQEFDGTADYISLGISLGTLMGATTQYVTAWASTDVSGSTHGNQYQGRWVWADAGGYIGDSLVNATDGAYPTGDKWWAYNYPTIITTVGATYSTSTWTHRVFRHAGGTLYLHQNGSSIGSVTSGDTSNTAGQMTIGNGYSFSSTPFWDGKIDEIRFANTDLGADYAGEDYTNQNDTASYYTVTAMGGGPFEEDPAEGATVGEATHSNVQRPISESASTGEAARPSIERPIPESAAVSETVVANTIRNVVVTDSMVLVDEGTYPIENETVIAKARHEILTIAETISRAALTLAYSLSDTVLISESPKRYREVSVADTVAAAEALARVFLVTVTDTFASSEGTTEDYKKYLADTALVAEVVAHQLVLSRTVTDSAAATEAAAKLLASIRPTGGGVTEGNGGMPPTACSEQVRDPFTLDEL